MHIYDPHRINFKKPGTGVHLVKKVKWTNCLKTRWLEFEKEVGIAIKSTQTSNQLEPVTRNISGIGYTVIIQSQMHEQIKHSLSHLQDWIPTLAGIK